MTVTISDLNRMFDPNRPPALSVRPVTSTRKRYEGDTQGVKLLDFGNDVDQTPPLKSLIAEQLTDGQKIALLKIRKNEWSKAVLQHLEPFGKAECTGDDYRSLVPLHLAIDKGGYRVPTHHGRWVADQVAMTIARERGMHVITHVIPKKGMGLAPYIRCTCGFHLRLSTYKPGHDFRLSHAAREHLRFVGATAVEIEAGACS